MGVRDTNIMKYCRAKRATKKLKIRFEQNSAFWKMRKCCFEYDKSVR